MKVLLSERSRRDLRAIATFIASDNPARARSFVEELTTACTSLSDRPLRYPLIPEYEAKGLRRRPHGSYAIVYTVGEGAITVVRVLHTAMDMDVALGGS